MTTIDTTPDVAAAPAAAEEGNRLAELAASLSTLRARATRSGPSLERRLAVAGGVLVPLGAALVLLAWYGAAHTSRVYLQIPYLISGGLLGVALTVTGGFCYFAFWLTRLVAEQRASAAAAQAVAERTVATLERIEALLAEPPPARRRPITKEG